MPLHQLLEIEIYFDPEAIREGMKGCYRARLARNPGIHDAGRSRNEALINFLITANSHGLHGKRENYAIVHLHY